MKYHRAPWECTYAKEEDNACRPGRVPRSDQQYFEIFCLCILQAGLSWGMVRKNWRRYRRGFRGFAIAALARTRARSLMKNPDVIRNEQKITALIYNAREFQRIAHEYGSFARFLRSLKTMKDEDACGLLTERFRHVGMYTAEFYLHCVGYWS